MQEVIKKRTKRFAVDCGLLCREIPRDRTFDAYCRQLIRSSASVGANYRAACRAKSNKDFLNKLKIVEEEADESMYWLEILMELGNKETQELKRLHKEGDELVAITVASIKTVRNRINSQSNKS